MKKGGMQMKKSKKGIRRKLIKTVLLILMSILICLLGKSDSLTLWNLCLRILLGIGILYLAVNLLGGIQKKEREQDNRTDSRARGNLPD